MWSVKCCFMATDFDEMCALYFVYGAKKYKYCWFNFGLFRLSHFDNIIMNQCFFNELFFHIAIKMIEIINGWHTSEKLNSNFRLISKLMHNALAHTVIPWKIFLNSTNDWHVET